jgi:hypothetical protein
MDRNEYLTLADQAHAMAKGTSPAAADALERMASDFQSMADKQRREFPRIIVLAAVIFVAYFALAICLTLAEKVPAAIVHVEQRDHCGIWHRDIGESAGVDAVYST